MNILSAQDTKHLNPDNGIINIFLQSISDVIYIDDNDTLTININESNFEEGPVIRRNIIFGMNLIGRSNFKEVYFSNNIVHGEISLYEITGRFQSKNNYFFSLDIYSSELRDISSISDTMDTFTASDLITNSILINNCSIYTLSLENISIKNYFTIINTDPFIEIYLRNLDFPLGKFFVDWDIFKKGKYYRINPTDNYPELYQIYSQLSRNYLAQGNKSDADAVMFELAQREEELFPSLSLYLYELFLGFGYKPLRYIFFLVLPTILFFAFIWYKFYYGMLLYIHDYYNDVDPTAINPLKKKFLINLTLFKHESVKENINLITRVWHSMIFSASVLLGIRFKKDWTNAPAKYIAGKNTFIYIVTLEYILGIGLIILFIVLAKGSYVSQFKSLLGI